MGEFAVSDDFFDGQTLRAASAAIFGGADILECVAIARRVKKNDLDGWYREWESAGQRAFDLGAAAEASGQVESARLAFLRACTYFRTAGLVFLGTDADARLGRSIDRQREAFRRAIPHLRAVVEPVDIPFGSITLPGYHYRVAGDGARRATVILLNGYDGTVEELYFANAQAALDRGYDVLAFDGPGQGSVLVEQGVPMRADWENVVPAVVDWLLDRGTADPDRIGLIGWSLGGFLAPRAASGEHRLAAVIADANFFDLYESVLDRIPSPLRAGFAAGRPAVVKTVGALLDEVAQRPTGGWNLRRGVFVHGVDSVRDYIRETPAYTLKGYAEKITCPTLITRGESDEVSASAHETFEAITAPKEFFTFTDAEGAGGHCELGARQLYFARAYGWLDRILQPSRLAS